MKAQITKEEQYARSFSSLRVLQVMHLACASGSQTMNEEAHEAASAVLDGALDTFKELEILELVGDRD